MTESKDISKKQDQIPKNRGSSRQLCPYCKSPTKKKITSPFHFVQIDARWSIWAHGWMKSTKFPGKKLNEVNL